MADFDPHAPRFDIFAEAFAATKHLKQRHIDRMLSVGIPRRALAMIGADRAGIGVMTITKLPGSLFEPADDGQPHLILPVSKYRPDLGAFYPVDLIAMQTGEPERWRWRNGRAWALGAENLGCDAPLQVVANPLDWIAAEGRALCILDWTAPGWCWELVRSELQLNLPDDRLRQRLRNALASNAALPDMEVPRAA